MYFSRSIGQIMQFTWLWKELGSCITFVLLKQWRMKSKSRMCSFHSKIPEHFAYMFGIVFQRIIGCFSNGVTCNIWISYFYDWMFIYYMSDQLMTTINVFSLLCHSCLVLLQSDKFPALCIDIFISDVWCCLFTVMILCCFDHN